MGDWGDRGNKGDKNKAGYEYLLAYKITVPIYDLTVQFCGRWISSRSRTKDQMEQAARSGMQNTAEGNKQQSLKSYIQLTGVSRGSLPNNPEIAVNLMVTLINQANYLLDRLISSLKKKHTREGGFSESLYRKRKEYMGDWGDRGNRGSTK